MIWDPRRSGKTTLLQKYKDKLNVPIFNFNTISDRELFLPKRESLEKIARENKVILVDEVQYSPESTVALKILYDEFDVKIIATGSSELRQKSKDFDSLAGRYFELYCLPLSIEEVMLSSKVKSYSEESFLSESYVNMQVFGAYPELQSASGLSDAKKIDMLEKIIEAYVLKDIVNIYKLKNIKLARDILLKIALQLGSEVSIREIASSFQANIATVSSYIEIFIKNYVLIPLYPFKTNLRRAVSENRKLYFMDIGVRNALVNDFRPISLRPDKGGLFENLVISELEKTSKNHGLKINKYFYREYGGKEVDLVIEDYRKNYWVFEIKSKRGYGGDIFPIQNKYSNINSENFYQELVRLMDSIKASMNK